MVMDPLSSPHQLKTNKQITTLESDLLDHGKKSDFSKKTFDYRPIKQMFLGKLNVQTAGVLCSVKNIVSLAYKCNLMLIIW